MSNTSQFMVIDNHEERKNYNGFLVRLCTAIYPLLMISSLLALISFVYLLLFTKLWFIPIVYYSYIILVNTRTCSRGGGRWDWVHKARFWSYMAAYFPVRLRYSQKFKLNPSENYILTYHPHGIYALGCISSFATDGMGISKLFPGITSRLMGHESWFWVPIVREIFMLRGDCSVSSASFDYILSRRWKQNSKRSRESDDKNANATSTPITGNLLALCVGGQAEAGLSDMQTLKIVCATRKGFVKKALIHGTHLVPCIAFGENSIYKRVDLQPGSLAHRIETKWYQLFKFKHPVHYGDGFFPGSWPWRGGVVPFKRPITVCMGDPIEVERVAEPSQEQIDQLHSLYMERMRALYEEHRDLCNEYDLKLEFV